MNILFASDSCCARVIKEGIALINNGHQVTFLQRRIANPDMQYVLPAMVAYQGHAQYSAKLKNFSNIDIIHVHNEPSWLGYVAKEARPDLPVVFDAHDLCAVRDNEIVEDEIRSLALCDGIIYPSKGYRDFVRDQLPRLCSDDQAFEAHQAIRAGNNPSEIIYSMCNEYMLDLLQPLPRVNGIVYQGGVSPFMDHRDYREISKYLAGARIPFHIYGTDMEYAAEYIATGAVYMPTLPYLDLMRNLTRYDWGLCGCPISHPQWENAMPNKLFEYIAAGIPVIVINAAECAEFVMEHGLGVVVDSINAIPRIYDRHEKYRERVAEKRAMFTMESQVPKILALYEEVKNREESDAGR